AICERPRKPDRTCQAPSKAPRLPQRIGGIAVALDSGFFRHLPLGYRMEIRRFVAFVTLLAVVTLSGCGEEAPASAEAVAAAPTATGSAFEAIPRERLYGASTAENLWMPRYEMEVPDLPPGWNGVQIA